MREASVGRDIVQGVGEAGVAGRAVAEVAKRIRRKERGCILGGILVLVGLICVVGESKVKWVMEVSPARLIRSEDISQR